MKAMGFRIAYVWIAFLVFSTCAISNQLPDIPQRAGKFVVDDKCPRLTGRYMTAGECIDGRCESLASSLRYILSIPYPPQSMRFGKEDKRHADLFFDDGDTFRAQIAIGGYVTKWETHDFTCEQGWLKLSRHNEGGAEGNYTKVNIMTYLRRNTAGDLIVFRKVQGRTSNLFGLVWSNIDDQGWLVFKQAE